jgi:hypothetical protein
VVFRIVLERVGEDAEIVEEAIHNNIVQGLNEHKILKPLLLLYLDDGVQRIGDQ